MNTKTHIKHIDQKRAEFAYSKVSDVSDKETIRSSYRSYIRSLSMLIQQNGLGAALTYLKAKASEENQGKAYAKCYEHISEWVAQKSEWSGSFDESEDLVAQLIIKDPKTYRALTREVLELLNWLRRFAEGLIEEGNTKS